MSVNTVLQAQHLKKYYRGVRAVEDVSFEVHKGEIFGFLGPNGAGKTTTIGMALGLIYPTALPSFYTQKWVNIFSFPQV